MHDEKSIRCALSVLDHLSIRAAAVHLGLQPSAVSRRIRSLEEELGVGLFVRNTGGTQPTLAGRRFLERARWALAELDEAARSAAGSQNGQGGTLAIAFYPSLSKGILHRILSEHRARFPLLDFAFREGASEEQLGFLRQHRVDVAFLIDVNDAPGAISEHLWDERVYIVAPEHHAISTWGPLTWASLREEDFIVRAYGSGPVIYAWLAGKLDPGGYAPNIRQHDICRESLLGLVSTGLALTVVAESATAIAIPGIVYLPVVDENATVSIRMAWLNGNDNPALGPFLSHARRIARQSRPA